MSHRRNTSHPLITTQFHHSNMRTRPTLPIWDSRPRALADLNPQTTHRVITKSPHPFHRRTAMAMNILKHNQEYRDNNLQGSIMTIVMTLQLHRLTNLRCTHLETTGPRPLHHHPSTIVNQISMNKRCHIRDSYPNTVTSLVLTVNTQTSMTSTRTDRTKVFTSTRLRPSPSTRGKGQGHMTKVSILIPTKDNKAYRDRHPTVHNNPHSLSITHNTPSLNPTAGRHHVTRYHSRHICRTLSLVHRLLESTVSTRFCHLSKSFRTLTTVTNCLLALQTIVLTIAVWFRTCPIVRCLTHQDLTNHPISLSIALPHSRIREATTTE